MGAWGGAIGGEYPSVENLVGTGYRSTVSPDRLYPGVSIKYGIGQTAREHIASMLVRTTFKQNIWRGVSGGLISSLPVAE